MSALPPDADPAIEVRGLVTRFGVQVVHNGLDLTVRRGEIMGVVGPSGEGKSVLLRQIVGLEHPEAGVIDVLGVRVAPEAERGDMDQLEKRWGVMFQDGALFSNLTVKQNVALPMREHTNTPEPLISELADLKLSMAGLGEDAHHKRPSEISGGMRKRAALARALALEPELVFLDEPTAGLDPVSANRFDRLVRELTDALGLTVFLVTHDLDTLYEICDRVAVLLNGRVATVGALEEVRACREPWIQDYFAGPRGRSAAASARVR